MSVAIFSREQIRGFGRRIRGVNLVYLFDLLRELVLRDVKLRYKSALSGALWSLLNPITQLIVFSFVFSKAVPVHVEHYSSFIFCGLLVWGWFNTSLFVGTESFTSNRDLVRRPGFVPAVLPLVRVTSDLLHFLLALPLLLAFLLWNGCVFGWSLLLLPVVIALQFLLTLGIVFIIATTHVTFRDTQHLLGVFLMLAFYLTPVFYDSCTVPTTYQFVYRLNPLVHLLEMYRAILLHHSAPNLTAFTMLLLFISLLLGTGYALFARASRHFSEEL